MPRDAVAGSAAKRDGSQCRFVATTGLNRMTDADMESAQ